MSCGVGLPGSDLALLWLRCRPAVVTPVRLLAWEPPHASGVALKRQKTKQKKVIQKNLLTKQNSLTDIENKLTVTKGEGGSDKLGGWN